MKIKVEAGINRRVDRVVVVVVVDGYGSSGGGWWWCRHGCSGIMTSQGGRKC